MQENPYSAMINMMKSQAKGQIPAWIRFGKIISPSPLKVEISNTVQERKDLLLSANLGELHAGDSVLTIPINNNQQFIVLCRVVGA
jgi:hypothetical protein